MTNVDDIRGLFQNLYDDGVDNIELDLHNPTLEAMEDMHNIALDYGYIIEDTKINTSTGKTVIKVVKDN